MADQVKVAVLEERLENFEMFVSKLDAAIEKIAEVNNNVSRMLAVDKIDKLRDKMDSDHNSVSKRLSLLERKLWMGLGALGVVVALSNPQAIKLIRPLLSGAESVIVSPAVAGFVNGSR